MKLVASTCLFILIGLMTFYISPIVNRPDMYYWYYLWDKGKDVLLIGCVVALLPKQYKRIPLFVFIFAIIRFIWDIIVESTGIYVNHPLAVNILFATLVAACITVVITEWRKLK